MTQRTLTLELPCPEGWPYRELISRHGLRYYELTEEFVLPSYNEHFWKNINPDTIGCCMFLRGAGCHIIPTGSSITLKDQEKRDLYNFIKVEERKLKREELMLFDRLNGKTEKVSLPSYTCCWSSYDDFKTKADLMFSQSRLYVLCPEEIDKQIKNKKEQIAALANTKCELIYDIVNAASENGETQNFSLYYIEVCAPDARNRQKSWFETSKILAESLRGPMHELNIPESFSRNPDAYFISSPSKGRFY